MNFDVEKHLAELKTCVDEEIERALPPQAAEEAADLPEPGEMPNLLRVAMRYSVAAGGKRLRPAMLLAAADVVGAKRELALPYACAVEFIHTYALIHDDLPAMDNDDMRRGRLSNHKVFGEGIAILAGDGLQAYAYEWALKRALESGVDAERHLRAMYEISKGSGVTGIVAGQTLDIVWEGREKSREMLEFIHLGKTASLIVAPLRAGFALGGADEKMMDAITEYGKNVGVMFQIVDDILDVTGSAEKLGKKPGSDASQGKLTYPAIYGLEGSREQARMRTDKAVAALNAFGAEADFLRGLAESLLVRDK